MEVLGQTGQSPEKPHGCGTISEKSGLVRGPPTPLEAATRLDAYERVMRAIAGAGPNGPPRPPVLYLSEEQLAALFAPRQLEALVTLPLRASDAECPS